MAYLGNSPLDRLFGVQAVTLGQGQTAVNIGYTPGVTMFFKNGALLEPETDYTATDGSVVTLANPAIAGDVLISISLAQFAVANALPLSGGTLSGPLFGPASASESLAGLIKLATSAQAQALVDDETALTPKKLTEAFSGANRSVTGDNRYQIFPGTGGTRRVVMNIKTTLSVGSILAPGQTATVNFDFPIAVKAGTYPGIVATTRNAGLVIGLNGAARWPGGDTIAARNITENNMGPGLISDVHIVVVGDI